MYTEANIGSFSVPFKPSTIQCIQMLIQCLFLGPISLQQYNVYRGLYSVFFWAILAFHYIKYVEANIMTFLGPISLQQYNVYIWRLI